MAFESLAERYTFAIPGFPQEWLPLISLYDPDLPLFPLQYFHAIDPELPAGNRPSYADRVFGFIHHVNLDDTLLTVTVAVNKDLSRTSNAKYRKVVETEARARLGLGDPVKQADIDGALQNSLAASNSLLKELWIKIVDTAFGKSLPFGRMWDGTLGLFRFVASWYSDGGRKGELIQTHFFVSEFGVKIQTGGGIHADFYLLPTFSELRDKTNPLNLFPEFGHLAKAADEFVSRYCDSIDLTGGTFSAFRMKKTGVGNRLKTQSVLALINKFDGTSHSALFKNYTTFDRGPVRSVISLLMISDIRNRRWLPDALSPTLCAEMYKKLKGSYQSPKVIQLYSQQCFGSRHALPIDNWVMTFLSWPLDFRSKVRGARYAELFSSCDRWGKVERLIWLAAQSRKVHSSVSAEILWCIRFGGKKKRMRGANPLACKICDVTIRDACQSYRRIEHAKVGFNAKRRRKDGFLVLTTARNNVKPNQRIEVCEGPGVSDEYSVRDRSKAFAIYPSGTHKGEDLSVSDFIKRY